MEDFTYLYDVFKENHGTISITARMTGFDWLAHKEDFEEEVRRTKNDREFAEVMSKLLCLTMDAHTQIHGGQLVAGCRMPGTAKIYQQIVAEKGLEQAADYWLELAKRAKSTPSYIGFPALYHAGEYIVVRGFTTGGVEIKPGYKVVGVNGVPVDEYVRSHLGYNYLSWDPVRRKIYEDPLLVPAKPGTVAMLFRDLAGDLVETKLSTKDLPPWQYKRCPVYSANDGVRLREGLFVKVFPDLAAYIRVEEMFQWSDPQDVKRFREFLNSVKDLPALIIDIRGNFGGDDGCWGRMIQWITAQPLRCAFTFMLTSGNYVHELLKELTLGRLISKPGFIGSLSPAEKARIAPEFFSPRFLDQLASGEEIVNPEDSIGFRGHVYLLVDDKSCSSSANFAYVCKEAGWATIVGTWPGGGVGFSPAIAILPNSRMALTFPVGFGLNPDLTANEEFRTMPDVLVEDYQAFLKAYTAIASGELHNLDPEYDPILAACFELIKKQDH